VRTAILYCLSALAVREAQGLYQYLIVRSIAQWTELYTERQGLNSSKNAAP